ncbi:MAG: hypothetical protein U1E06_10310 [Tabrizicola sp.]|uniref:hypothetical protein n=1 Tax=Tabrizicola sp. TaxID=2005166 RepID=UPI00273314EF|nr:hypothetical protein [Tabrizicola sp.]MDP3264376.1 hypothetical protein [Tabrizicola sp.]MDP3648814.1 hypothetical protein [Paracoccaceae bacterium]MDZ4067223.1 hypothetical protein [Tabrizicola sp.]
MTRTLTGGLAAAITLLPAMALAHPGHAAPAFHVHWEIVALAALVLAAFVAFRLARRR